MESSGGRSSAPLLGSAGVLMTQGLGRIPGCVCSSGEAEADRAGEGAGSQRRDRHTREQMSAYTGISASTYGLPTPELTAKAERVAAAPRKDQRLPDLPLVHGKGPRMAPKTEIGPFWPIPQALSTLTSRLPPAPSSTLVAQAAPKQVPSPCQVTLAAALCLRGQIPGGDLSHPIEMQRSCCPDHAPVQL